MCVCGEKDKSENEEERDLFARIMMGEEDKPTNDEEPLAEGLI